MILIICEHDAGQLKRYSEELAAKAVALASATGTDVHAVVIGKAAQNAAALLGSHGVKRLTVLDAAVLESHYNSDGVTNVLTHTIQKLAPSIVLATASALGRDCLPRVAMRLKTGVVADCVALDIRDGKLVARHPVFAGKALIDCVVNGSPQMALARANAFGVPNPAGGAAAEVSVETADPGPMRALVKEVVTAERGEIDLTEATLIVSGGRALGSAENFKFVRELAQELGASVGASRAAVDAGYIGHDHQVGQTGKTVNPTLYIACGISGAIQHLAGMRTSRYIVAINKDPDAPIFTKADFGIVGDLFKILPVLTEKIHKAKT